MVYSEMKFMCFITHVLVIVTVTGVSATENKKHKERIQGEKWIDQEAQSSVLRDKRGSSKHVLHILKPVNKFKKYHVVEGKYHERFEKPIEHKNEEVHHTFSETHEHVHHDHENGKIQQLNFVPEKFEGQHVAENYENPESIFIDGTQHVYEESKGKVQVKHHHHHHHHNHVKTLVQKVPEPYPVQKVVEVPVEKIVHVPVEKVVHVPKPYPVEKIVEKVVHVPIEKIVQVPKPYPVEKIVEKPIEVEKKIPVEIKVPYVVEKVVHVPIEKVVEKLVHVPKPYAVEKVVEKIVPIPKPYPVVKTVPYPIPIKIPIHIPKPVPYPVEKAVPVPIEVEKNIPVPYKVEKVGPTYVPPQEPFKISYNTPFPASLDTHENEYASLDTKIYPIRFPKNKFHQDQMHPVQITKETFSDYARPAQFSKDPTHDQLLNPSNSNPKFYLSNRPNVDKSPHPNIQQKIIRDAKGANSSKEVYIRPRNQNIESNGQIINVAAIRNNESQIHFPVPIELSPSEPLLQQSSDITAQIYPVQMFPLQLLQLQPMQIQPTLN